MRMTKKQADALEAAVQAMSGREYAGFVAWLASGGEGDLWDWLPNAGQTCLGVAKALPKTGLA